MKLSALLATHPLPAIRGDKHDRGVAVVVAGDPSCPGAAILSATAALRAGAGKVQVVTDAEIVHAIGTAVPEALVLAGPSDGAPSTAVRERVAAADAVLIGPGLQDISAAEVGALAGDLPSGAPLVLDAAAVAAAPHLVGHRLVLVPNVTEAADLAAVDASAGPERLGPELAHAFGATVAVRGEDTVVTDGEGCWSLSGDPGLGTAGSGDVLAGLVVGLCARGLDPVGAVGWAVAIHAKAGELLAAGGRGYGYLARELLDVVPDAVAALHTGPR
jgi:ADP-dependent NAD(P)H-hydrate dehydratase